MVKEVHQLVQDIGQDEPDVGLARIVRERGSWVIDVAKAAVEQDRARP